MAYRIYRAESVFTSPDSVLDLHICQDFCCPFPSDDLDEYFGNFIYDLVTEADCQISELYGDVNHKYSLSFISLNLIGDDVK